MDFVAYSLTGTYDYATNIWTPREFDTTFIAGTGDDELPHFWDTYPHVFHSNESFWFVQ